MSRKVVRLTLDHLAATRLRRARRACSGSWTRSAASACLRRRPPAEKEAWVSHVLREWGSCGRVVLVDDRPVGYAIYAPPSYLPGAGAFPTAPVSPDAVLLSTVWVDPRTPAAGSGRMLVQGMARDLVKRGGICRGRGVRRHPRPRPRANGCVVPADFLGSVGFKTHRPHRTTPRMRMDLRTALTWRTRSRRRWSAWSAPSGPRQPGRDAWRGEAASRERTTKARTALRSGPSFDCVGSMKSASSLSSIALGRAPTIDFTTSPSL